MPARYKQVARAFRASFYPLALREYSNRYNLKEETEDTRIKENDLANEEPEDTSNQGSDSPDEEDLEKGEGFSDEGPEIDEEEWAREATAEEKRQFSKIPEAEIIGYPGF
uniref:Uncharacterized protein n=1 Tax=Tetranychus urticae TaxID=32264 RepID=T1KIJ6_TETUR